MHRARQHLWSRASRRYSRSSSVILLFFFAKKASFHAFLVLLVDSSILSLLALELHGPTRSARVDRRKGAQRKTVFAPPTLSVLRHLATLDRGRTMAGTGEETDELNMAMHSPRLILIDGKLHLASGRFRTDDPVNETDIAQMFEDDGKAFRGFRTRVKDGHLRVGKWTCPKPLTVDDVSALHEDPQ